MSVAPWDFVSSHSTAAFSSLARKHRNPTMEQTRPRFFLFRCGGFATDPAYTVWAVRYNQSGGDSGESRTPKEANHVL
jgi:hypothetical protein